MIHERNKKITLDAQIAEIREQIRLGKQSFPIDIVDTIGNDSQLYYELENGYWEKYLYGADGTIIGYQDSKNIKVLPETNPNPDFDLMFDSIMRTIAMRQLAAKVQTDPCKIGSIQFIPNDDKLQKAIELFERFEMEECELMISEAEKEQQEEGEIMVYLVEQNDVRPFDNVPYRHCHDNFFINEAKRQENVYTIKAYQNLINMGEISMTSKLIRFI